MKLIKFKYLGKHFKSILVNYLTNILNIFHICGFNINKLLMDGEFESPKYLVGVDLNTP